MSAFVNAWWIDQNVTNGSAYSNCSVLKIEMIFWWTQEESESCVSNMQRTINNNNEMFALQKAISENEWQNIEIEFIDETPKLTKIIDICKNLILEVKEYFQHKKLLIVTILNFKFNFSF